MKVDRSTSRYFFGHPTRAPGFTNPWSCTCGSHSYAALPSSTSAVFSAAEGGWGRRRSQAAGDLASRHLLDCLTDGPKGSQLRKDGCESTSGNDSDITFADALRIGCARLSRHADPLWRPSSCLGAASERFGEMFYAGPVASLPREYRALCHAISGCG